MRGVAAVCALVLVAGNALAAMGLCVAKTPTAPASIEASVADAAPCPQHVADAGSGVLPDLPAASTHCPQEDPGVQARAGDVPAADLPLVAAPVRAPLAQAQGMLRGDATANDLPPEPLYARLSRLLL
jgi:hypothetical protein